MSINLNELFRKRDPKEPLSPRKELVFRGSPSPDSSTRASSGDVSSSAPSSTTTPSPSAASERKSSVSTNLFAPMPAPSLGWCPADEPEGVSQRLKDLENTFKPFMWYATALRLKNDSVAEQLECMGKALFIDGVLRTHWTFGGNGATSGTIFRRLEAATTLSGTPEADLKWIFHAYAVQAGADAALEAARSNDPAMAGLRKWGALEAEVVQAKALLHEGEQLSSEILQIAETEGELLPADAVAKLEGYKDIVREVEILIHDVMQEDPVYVFVGGSFRVRISPFCTQPAQGSAPDWLAYPRDMHMRCSWSLDSEVESLCQMARIMSKKYLFAFPSIGKVLRALESLTEHELFADTDKILDILSCTWRSPPATPNKHAALLIVAFGYLDVAALRCCPRARELTMALRELKTNILNESPDPTSVDNDGEDETRDASLAKSPEMDSSGLAPLEPTTRPLDARLNGNSDSQRNERNNTNEDRESIKPEKEISESHEGSQPDEAQDNLYILPDLPRLCAVVAKRKAEKAGEEIAQKKIRLELEQKNEKIARFEEERENLRASNALEMSSLKQRHAVALREESEKRTSLQSDHDRLRADYISIKTENDAIKKDFKSAEEACNSIRLERDTLNASNASLKREILQMKEALRLNSEHCRKLAQLLEQ